MARVNLWNISGGYAYQGNNIYRDSDGYIHVVGFENDPGDLYYAVSIDEGVTFTDGEGGGNGTKKTLATNINHPYPLLAPAIVVDSNKNIYIFWIDEADNELYFRKKSGSTGGIWDTGSGTSISDAVSTGGETVIDRLRVEIDTDDHIIITAMNSNVLKVFTTTDGGTTWEFTSSSLARPLSRTNDLCLDYNNNLWFVYTYSFAGIYYTKVLKITKNTGNIWSIGAPTTLYSDSYAVTDVGIVAERDSETIWVFQDYYDGSVQYTRYIKYATGSWGSWTNIENTGADLYRQPTPICDYDNNIYLFVSKHAVNDLWYYKWDGDNWSSRIDTEFVHPDYISVEHPRNLPQNWNRYVYALFLTSGESPNKACFDKQFLPLSHLGSDSITLSDEIFLKVSLEKLNLNDTINLSDNIQDWRDIINDFRMAVEVTEDISSDFRSVIEVISDDMINAFSMVYAGDLVDIESDIRYVTEPTYDITNDFRMLKQWQVPGDAGFQSLGKEYIKVYINGNPDDDVDINSITINKVLNGSHTANFIIGRPYDTANKPTIEYEAEIRYYEKNWGNYWLLYKGDINQINPGDNPDTIKINCQDKYWVRNREKKYFFVGHKPQDDKELYYETISSALSSGLDWNPGIGNFIPQTMNLFGRGESDCITSLITNAGNYAWFYDVDGNKKLWTADRGSIINLERQELEKNIGLYQVLKHSFTESVENLVNRFRVTMGDKIIRRFNFSGGSKEYDGYYYYLDLDLALTPAWDREYERLASDDYEPPTEANPEGKGHDGFDRHPTDRNSLYADVYTKYIIPFTSTDLEAYTDRFEPRISIEASIGRGGMECSVGIRRGAISNNILKTTITGGYTIDYKNYTVTFGERTYLYTEDENNQMNSTKSPIIRLTIWKQKFISRTDDPSDNPQDSGDITSPLSFVTDKMGDYAEIWGLLQLSGLGIQNGGWYVSGYDEDDRAIWQYVPSWDDTAFAQDMADWKLSQNCDKKVHVSVDLTIDAVCYYDINLAKLIMINGVLDDSLNITSMNYNFNTFTVTLSLENARYYKRSISIQPRGV